MMSSLRKRAIIILQVESLLTCLCVAGAIGIRFGTESAAMLQSGGIWVKIGLLMLVVQGAFYIFDLYDFRRIRQRATLYIRIFQATGLAAIGLAAVFYAVPQMMLGRGVFLVSLLLMLTMMSCWRIFAERIFGNPRRGLSNDERIFNKGFIKKAPGTNMLALVDFLFSPKTIELTFQPLIADWQSEYFEALKQGRTKKACWINIRYRFAFACTFIRAMGLSKVFSVFKQLSK